MQKTKDKFYEIVQAQREAINDMPEQKRVSPYPEPTPSQTLSRVLPSLKTLDRAAIDTLAKTQIHEVADGLKDAADVFTLATKGKLYFETLCDNLKPYVYAQNLAVKGDTYIKNGVELSPAELGVKYDYKSAQDPEYARLNAEFEAAKKAKEEREKFLKTIKGKLNTFDEDTGETITIYEPVKSGQSGYKTNVL